MGKMQLHSDPVLQHAFDLFQQYGYSSTTLSQIADASHIDLNSLTCDYGCKERIALQLYRDLCDSTLAAIPELAEGKIARRYVDVMTLKIEQYQTHADTMAALFAAAMLPDSSVTASEISPGTKDSLYQAFAELVQRSEDAPGSEDEADRLTMLLYTFHFLTIVFWLYDRTSEKKATGHLLDFLYDMFKLLRPLMMMPLIARALTKIAQIMMLVFGGARLVDDEQSST